MFKKGGNRLFCQGGMIGRKRKREREQKTGRQVCAYDKKCDCLRRGWDISGEAGVGLNRVFHERSNKPLSEGTDGKEPGGIS